MICHALAVGPTGRQEMGGHLFSATTFNYLNLHQALGQGQGFTLTAVQVCICRFVIQARKHGHHIILISLVNSPRGQSFAN